MLIEIAEDFWVDTDRIIHADNRSRYSATLKVEGAGDDEDEVYYCEVKAADIARTMAPIIAAIPGFTSLQCSLPGLVWVMDHGVDRDAYVFKVHRIPIPAWRMWNGELEPVLFGHKEYEDKGSGVLHPNGTVVARTTADEPFIFATEAEWMTAVRKEWIDGLEWEERQAAKKARAAEASE